MSKTSKPKAQPDQFGDLVDIAKIQVGDRLRALNPETVDALAGSMAHQGQLHPIVTRAVDGGSEFSLVVGAHRLAAAKHLGWTQIRATAHGTMTDDQAALAEIDENLCRAGLTNAEEELHLKRRKDVYECLHPETVHGAAGRGRKRSLNEISFLDDTAEKTGQGRSTIGKKITRAERTDDKALQDAAHTSLDKPGELEALSKKPKAEQRRLARAAKAGKNVSAKPEPTPVTGSAERDLDAAKAAGAALGQDQDSAPAAHDALALPDDGSIPPGLRRTTEAATQGATNGRSDDDRARVPTPEEVAKLTGKEMVAAMWAGMAEAAAAAALRGLEVFDPEIAIEKIGAEKAEAFARAIVAELGLAAPSYKAIPDFLAKDSNVIALVILETIGRDWADDLHDELEAVVENYDEAVSQAEDENDEQDLAAEEKRIEEAIVQTEAEWREAEAAELKTKTKGKAKEAVEQTTRVAKAATDRARTEMWIFNTAAALRRERAEQ
jgi:ParB family transcriptional regulator, chromosome partitioning protein